MNFRNQHYRADFIYSGLKETVRDMRKNETKAESIVWDQLRNRKFKGLKCRRQHQIGLFIVDFYCDELKLVIEIDGKNHSVKRQQERDRDRTLDLENEGFTVIRIQNELIETSIQDFLDVMEKIIPLPLGEAW